MKRKIIIGRIAVSCLIATTVIGTYKLLETSGFADHESIGTAKEYMAPDLFVDFGADDVDWREGIEYDKELYVLDVVDTTEVSAHLYSTGGTHPVEYRLRLKSEDDKLKYAAEVEAFEEVKALIETNEANTLSADKGEVEKEVTLLPSIEGEVTDVAGDEQEELSVTTQELIAIEDVLLDIEGIEGVSVSSEVDNELADTSKVDELETPVSTTDVNEIQETLVDIDEVDEESEKLEGELTELGIPKEHEMYEHYMNYLEYLEELKLENARINEVGSVYFFRDVTIVSPVEYEDLGVWQNGEYDLTEGIKYDKDEYTLSVINEDTFDITQAYTYPIQMELKRNDGLVYEFYRWVVVNEIEDVGNEDDGVAPVASEFPEDDNLKLSGTYYLDLKSENRSKYITINAPNVTLHLTGNGSIGGIILGVSVQSLTVWVEKDANITIHPALSYIPAIGYHYTSYGNTNVLPSDAKVFVLGEGNLTIIGGNATDGTTATTFTSNSHVSGGTAGGKGAGAAIGPVQSLSLYSNDENIKMIGGSGGRGGAGTGAYYWYTTGGSNDAVAYIVSGGGAGGGGYFALAAGYNSSSGGSGSGGSSVSWPAFYVPTVNNSNISGKQGGKGGTGSLGGGGGAGSTFDGANRSVDSTVFKRLVTGGAGGTVSGGTIIEPSKGSDGPAYTWWTQAYPGASSSNGYYTTVQGADGGAAGTTAGVDGNIYGTTIPVVLHYNGSTYADPVGSTGAIYNSYTTDATESNYRGTIGMGVNNFYGFSADITEIEEAPGNVVEVIESTPDKLGVSYNPAPVIDLEFLYTDIAGANSVAKWTPPDEESRNTGYELPDGYEITNYYVTAYTQQYGVIDEFTYTAAEVVQTDLDGNYAGFCMMPEEDERENVYYWAVQLRATNKSTGSSLLSPVTMEYRIPPVIAVIRPDDTGVALTNLKSALEYIKGDKLRENTLDDEGVAQYRLRYLVQYNHNEANSVNADADREALEVFPMGNTHLTFESNMINDVDTLHSKRYLLTADIFDLPKDNPNVSSDDNISVSFENINTKITTIHTNGSNLSIRPENNIFITNLRTVSEENVGNGNVITSMDKSIDIQWPHSIDKIDLSNGKYGPDLYIGWNEGEENSRTEFPFNSIIGANSFTVKANSIVKVLNELELTSVNEPINAEKNGHLIFKESSKLIIPGDSITNTVGNIYAREEKSEIEFSNAFGNSDGTIAPLRVEQIADIGETGLEVNVEDAHLQIEEWRGKDMIKFSSLDDIILEDYWSLRLIFGIDTESTSIELYDYRSMKIEVTFPNESVITFPSYEEAVEWIDYSYTGGGGKTATFTLKLIDDYDRLGLGGNGINSNDNIALRNIKTAGYNFIFTSALKDESTGERYEFYAPIDSGTGQELNGARNEVFCLPENVTRANNVNVTMEHMYMDYVEEIYMGNIQLTLYDTVSAENPITYYGTYNVEDAAGLANQSRVIIPTSQEIGINKDGVKHGVGFMGVYTLSVNTYSDLYLSKMTKVNNYATDLWINSDSEIHYLNEGEYSWKNITNNSKTNELHYDHKSAITSIHGGGISGTSFTLCFPTIREAVNRDLIVCYNLNAEADSGIASSYYYHYKTNSLGGSLANHVIVELRDNIISTESYICIVSDAGATDGYDAVSYYKNLESAANDLNDDPRSGKHTIVFLSDYEFQYNYPTSDNHGLQNINRTDIELEITSKKRPDLIVENYRHEVKSENVDPGGIEEKSLLNWNKSILSLNENEISNEDVEVDWSQDYYIIQPYHNTYYHNITLPAYGNTPVTFKDIIWEVRTANTQYILIEAGSGGVTVDDTMHSINSEIDIEGYYSPETDYSEHDPYIKILGGNYRNVWASNMYDRNFIGDDTAVSKVILEAGVIRNLSGGSSDSMCRRNTEIHLYGGEITESLRGRDRSDSAILNTIFVQEDMRLPKTTDYDLIRIGESTTVKMNDVLTRSVSTTAAGLLEFEANSQLQLYVDDESATDTVSTVGNIKTLGAGASLVLPRNKDQVSGFSATPVLTINSNTYGGTNSDGGALTLIPASGYEYIAPTYDEEGLEIPDPDADRRYKEGDNLIKVSPKYGYSKELHHYNNGFLPYGLMYDNTSDTNNEYIKIGYLPVSMAKNDGEQIHYSSILAAIEEIGADGDGAEDIDYTIIIREEGTPFTHIENNAINTYATKAKSITFTSAFVLTEKDHLREGESIGDEVIRYVPITTGYTNYVPTYWENMLMDYGWTYTITGNGIPLYMGTGKAPYLPKLDKFYGLEMVGNTVPNISGQATYPNTTHLEIGTGKYGSIYGGSSAATSGEIYMELGLKSSDEKYIENGLTITGNIYGGGVSKTVSGDVTMIINSLYSTNANTSIVGTGSGGSAGVTGDIYMELGDVVIGTDSGRLNVYGAQYSTITGNCTIVVAEDSATGPIADSGYVYGVMWTNTYKVYITGDLNVRIHNGSGLTGIYEHTYPGGQTSNLVRGEINVYLGSGGPGGGVGGSAALKASIDNIYLFDNLYIGYSEADSESIDDGVLSVPFGGGAADIMVNTSLDGQGNWRKGTIHLLEGSTLSLPATGTVRALNIKTDTTEATLNIGKTSPTSASNPLLLSGDNLSENDITEDGLSLNNRLVVGMHSRTYMDNDLAVNGDDLIKFTTTANARETDYVSGVNYLSVVENMQIPGTIEYGIVSTPIIVQTLVEHKDAWNNVTVPARGMNSSINTNINSTLNTVTKTLHFSLTNLDENGEYSGNAIQSGYISNSPVPDANWAKNGTSATGNLANITVTVDTEHEGLWSGKTYLAIESYGINNKPYYAHVRDVKGYVKTILLDVHSPIYTTEPIVEQVNGGDYHITMTLHDPSYPEAAGSDGILHPYTASKLYLAASAIGTTTSTEAQKAVLQNREVSVDDDNFVEVRVLETNETHMTSTAVITKEDLEALGNVDMDNIVVYLFIKDQLGNTREIAIPLSEYLIDVSIPTRVGMVAFSSDTPDTQLDGKLLAPECFVINNGSNRVKAEVIGADIKGDNPIEFVTGSDQIGEDKMWLVLSSDYSPLSYQNPFGHKSISELNNSSVHVGNMSPANDKENAAYYTFQSIYNAHEMSDTGDWSLFTMKYRFTVLPE